MIRGQATGPIADHTTLWLWNGMLAGRWHKRRQKSARFGMSRGPLSR